VKPIEFLTVGPLKPSDLIGKAGIVTRVMLGRISAGATDPIRTIFYGDPGTGKSAICRMMALALLKHASGLRHMSAAQVTADNVRDWLGEMRYRSDDWRVWWIEECDAVSPQVEVLMLQFLDEMPARCAALFTSNVSLGNLSQRFQSRCQTHKIVPPKAEDVAAMLHTRWPEIGRKVCHQIAEQNAGDVRASLNDAQMAIDVERYNKEESK